MKNFAKFGETISSVKIVQGVRWRVHIKKQKKEDALLAALIADPDYMDVSSTYEVTGAFKLLSFEGSAASLRAEISHTFGRHIPPYKTEILLFLNKTMDSYVRDDVANVVFEFKVQKSAIVHANLNDMFKERDKHTL